jgi:hypothetical protein
LPSDGKILLADPETPQGPPSAQGTALGSVQWWSDAVARAGTEHPSKEVILGGHGYRKPWETDTFQVPAGTKIVFYVLDDTGLEASLANILAKHGSGNAQVLKHLVSEDARAAGLRLKSQLTQAQQDLKFKRTYGPSDEIMNYTVTPWKATDVVAGTYVSVDSRVKLSSLVRANLGTIHSANCRLVDWWGSFAELPGRHIHEMPQGWTFVKMKDYMGYLGPQNERPSRAEPKF